MPPVLLQHLQHVTIADLGPHEFDTTLPKRLLKTEITHQRANHRAF